MIRTLTCIGLLAAGVVCVSEVSTSSRPEGSCDSAEVTVFITGHERGQLKPCGCFGGQLGGIDRRAAVLERVPQERRLVMDTGELVAGRSEQDLIKFNIVVQAFALLGYDVVALTAKDVEVAEQLGLLEGLSGLFDVVAAGPQDTGMIPDHYSKMFTLPGDSLCVTVTVFDVAAGDIEMLYEQLGGGDMPSLNIVVVDSLDQGIIASIAETGVVDCVVTAPQADEPTVMSDPNAECLVVSAGRRGKYVGRLTVRVAEGEKKLQFTSVAVTEDLPQAEPLAALYKDYQQMVKEADLLADYPKLPLAEGLEYVGSKSCKMCHAYEYEKWSGKKHASAYATLEEVGSQYDPECVICHVVGLEYESGFVCEDQTPHLKDVGCENCHGPGSEHMVSLGASATTGPQMACLDCHTPEHSGDYAGNEEEFLERIVHWREPLASRKVSEPNSAP